MAIRKQDSNSNAGEQPDTVPAGVDPQTEKDAKADSKEVKDVEAADFAPEEDDGLTELPEGAMLTANADAPLTPNAAMAAAASVAGDFNDDFVGKGGTYAIDPISGERKVVYEKFLNSAGKERYRPAP